MISCKRILIIYRKSDEAIWLWLALMHEGYAVHIARGGEEGCAYAAHDPPDLILLDNDVMTEDGLNVLQRLRSQSATASIPMIVLAAQARHKVAAQAPQDMADLLLYKEDFIGDNERLDLLCAMINRLLGRADMPHTFPHLMSRVVA